MTRERLDLLREADAIVMDGLRRHGLYDQIWQCPTVLVPLELDGAGRELVIVRPIHSERGMTATPAPLPAALVAELRQADPGAARRERPRARHHVEAAGHDRVGVTETFCSLSARNRATSRMSCGQA